MARAAILLICPPGEGAVHYLTAMVSNHALKKWSRSIATNRADFSTQTRRILAERAGHRCSAPDCDQITIGPGPGANDVANIGTASHIFAAAAGGPRRTGGLTDDQRRAPSNGIWLCATHGRLVDTNDGGSYPAPLLQGWRSLHEAKSRMALRGARDNFGWVESLRVWNSPTLNDYTMTLGAHNLVVGDIGVGKTTLLDLLACPSSPERLERYRSWKTPIKLEMRWHDPELRSLELVSDADSTTYTLNGKSVPFVSSPCQVVSFPRHFSLHPSKLPELFNLDLRSLVNTLRASQDLAGGSIFNAEIGKYGALHIAVKRRGETLWIRPDAPGLSGGEKTRLYIDMCLAVTAARSGGKATLLVLDDVLERFDSYSRAHVLRRFTERPWPFQIIATGRADDSTTAVGAEWLVTHLRPRFDLDHFLVDQERDSGS